MGVLNIPTLQQSDPAQGGQMLSALTQLLLRSKLEDGQDTRKTKAVLAQKQLEKKQADEQTERTASSLEDLMNPGITRTTPIKPEEWNTGTIKAPENGGINPDFKNLPRDSEILDKVGESLLEQRFGLKEPSIESQYVKGTLPPEQSDRYIGLKQTLVPVQSMENGKPVVKTLGNKTGTVKTIAEGKPLSATSINFNNPSDAEIKNAAWKVANGEITLSEIPARSTARMRVLNELSTSPAYKDVNLAQGKANIKKMQDPTVIRSNALIGAIEQPLQAFEKAFVELNNTGIMPVNAGANWFLKNTGDPRIATVNAYRNELVREIQRALVNSGAIAQAGVEQQLDLLNSSYSLPQIKGSLAAIREILDARAATQTSPAFPDNKPAYDPRTQSGPSPTPQGSQSGTGQVQTRSGNKFTIVPR